MKKLITMTKPMTILIIYMLFLTSCNDPVELERPSEQEIEVDMTNFHLYTEDISGTLNREGSQEKCQTMHVLGRQLEENPALYKEFYDAEVESRRFQAAYESYLKLDESGFSFENGTHFDYPIDLFTRYAGNAGGFYNIQVAVHVIYNNEDDNISDAQIMSQIDVLNADFRKKNADINQVPRIFASVAGDAGIHFNLKEITRTYSSIALWDTSDKMKYTSQGGIDAQTPEKILNIWVCKLGGGVLGYAQFPFGNSATDGVVITTDAFGSTRNLQPPYNKGRTATHEVGHYLNLFHIWGNLQSCSDVGDDMVEDTPSSSSPNFGCPTSLSVVKCSSVDMTMNFMDYTDDACMYMFTNGQKNRMRTLFNPSGPRRGLLFY